MEKNYVVNVKTSKGTIITARGDSAEELIANVNDLVAQGGPDAISTLEEAFTGVSTPRVLATDPVAIVQASLGGEIVTEVPAFAPKAPPVQASAPSAGDKACIHGTMVKRTGNGAKVQASAPSAGDKACIHGTMVKRTGNGAKGEWRGYFCPTPKGTPDQCSASFANRNTPEWNSF